MSVVGIDLGTTNSVVALFEGGEALVLPNSEGSRTTPSVVSFGERGERLVGQIAKRQAATNPESTIYAVKRLMGRKFDDREVTRHRQICPYQVVAAANGDAWVGVGGKAISPAEISAQILAKMRLTAEDYLGEKVTQAVVTVPAYFDDSQRQATKDAGRIAGLEVLRIINEPTAAALAYGAERARKQGRAALRGHRGDAPDGPVLERIAVYDLGGGTFDISILELLGGVFQVRSTNGDTFLGGEDFDQRIIEHLAGLFEREHGIDLRHDRMALQRLREAAERAKHELSSALETDVQLPFIAAGPGGPLHFSTRLSRRQLETMTADLVERTLEPCRIALADAGLGPRDVEQVILVGGQTRMPLVQEKVGDFFQRRPHRAMNPDEVVAVGAAIQAAVLRGQMQDVLLLDVTPLSLGVETAGGVFTRLIARNTTIPTRKSEVFSTAVDNQPLVNVHVLQGEREMAADNKSLARLQLLDIPPAPRGVPQIEVSFEIDADGLVKVAARDLGTGKQQSASIVSTSGLTEEEVGRLLGEAESMREVDAGKRELAELRNRAATLIYGSERALLEDGYGIDDALRAGVDRDLAACREVVEGDDPGLLRAAVLALEASAHKITERIYAAAARPDGESPGRQS